LQEVAEAAGEQVPPYTHELNPVIGPGPGFDPDYALTTSLDDPVIIASITVVGEPPGPAADRRIRQLRSPRGTSHSVGCARWRFGMATLLPPRRQR
jgi:hypothetical protein